MNQEPTPKELPIKFKIETTVNIDKEVYNTLTEAAKKLRVSRSKLVVMLINRMVEQEEPSEEDYVQHAVRYQESRDEENWKTLHIVLLRPDYEFFDDVRKLWKMSVSFLVAYVTEHYLVDLEKIDNKSTEEDFTDNYRDCAHYTRYFKQNDVQCILLCWQIPEAPITEPPG